MLDEPVHLTPYSPLWADLFEAEQLALAPMLPREAAIEHIGSTAVPGLIGKPIVDVMVGLKGVPPPDSVCDALRALGYETLGEAGIFGRWYFRRRQPSSLNLHVVEVGGTLWRRNMLLRDYLRASPDARHLYARTKQAALNGGHTNLLDYSRAKSPVIELLLDEARAWQESTSL